MLRIEVVAGPGSADTVRGLRALVSESLATVAEVSQPGLAGLDDGTWIYDHIGSTSVPGLAAKRFVDLQLGVTGLPEEGSAADAIFDRAGYQATRGSRPDSPGVYRDAVLGPVAAPEPTYRKRLYVRPDPPLPSVLHVRLIGAQWQVATVRLRDWLRASPQARRDYEAAKRQAAARHAGDADFDDYTRAKAAFFRGLSLEPG
jgi:dephospho-CoA kinase